MKNYINNDREGKVSKGKLQQRKFIQDHIVDTIKRSGSASTPGKLLTMGGAHCKHELQMAGELKLRFVSVECDAEALSITKPGEHGLRTTGSCLVVDQDITKLGSERGGVQFFHNHNIGGVWIDTTFTVGVNPLKQVLGNLAKLCISHNQIALDAGEVIQFSYAGLLCKRYSEVSKLTDEGQMMYSDYQVKESLPDGYHLNVSSHLTYKDFKHTIGTVAATIEKVYECERMTVRLFHETCIPSMDIQTLKSSCKTLLEIDTLSVRESLPVYILFKAYEKIIEARVREERINIGRGVAEAHRRRRNKAASTGYLTLSSHYMSVREMNESMMFRTTLTPNHMCKASILDTKLKRGNDQVFVYDLRKVKEAYSDIVRDPLWVTAMKEFLMKEQASIGKDFSSIDLSIIATVTPIKL